MNKKKMFLDLLQHESDYHKPTDNMPDENYYELDVLSQPSYDLTERNSALVRNDI